MSRVFDREKFLKDIENAFAALARTEADGVVVPEEENIQTCLEVLLEIIKNCEANGFFKTIERDEDFKIFVANLALEKLIILRGIDKEERDQRLRVLKIAYSAQFSQYENILMGIDCEYLREQEKYVSLKRKYYQFLIKKAIKELKANPQITSVRISTGIYVVYCADGAAYYLLDPRQKLGSGITSDVYSAYPINEDGYLQRENARSQSAFNNPEYVRYVAKVFKTPVVKNGEEKDSVRSTEQKAVDREIVFLNKNTTRASHQSLIKSLSGTTFPVLFTAYIPDKNLTQAWVDPHESPHCKLPKKSHQKPR